MLREVDISDISDGTFYGKDDMVKVGCHDCENCSDCCRSTGDSIILDPLDLYRLQKGIHKTFEEMIEKEIEIRMVDGMILPNIMQHDENDPDKEDGCPFLDGGGRCSIHPYRPGFCRLFPLGRYYMDGEERTFRYFLQKDECTKADAERYEVRVRDWLDIPETERYEAYIRRWHFFLKDVGNKRNMLTEKSRDQITRYILQMFYVMPYQTDQDFYLQFELRMSRTLEALKPLGIISC